jgi:hypothetical protein
MDLEEKRRLEKEQQNELVIKLQEFNAKMSSFMELKNECGI